MHIYEIGYQKMLHLSQIFKPFGISSKSAHVLVLLSSSEYIYFYNSFLNFTYFFEFLKITNVTNTTNGYSPGAAKTRLLPKCNTFLQNQVFLC